MCAMSRRPLAIVLALATGALAGGCEGRAEREMDPAASASLPPPAADDSAVGSPTVNAGADRRQPLVDPAQAPAVAGADGWMYHRTAETDLDGDGQSERIVVMARAEVRDGRPLWDDGQPWQVYVEEPDGERTHVYARFVQLGAVTMRLGLAEDGRSASIVVLEHVPHRMAMYELEYRGPGQVEIVHRYERMLDPAGEVASPVLPEY